MKDSNSLIENENRDEIKDDFNFDVEEDKTIVEEEKQNETEPKKEENKEEKL